MWRPILLQHRKTQLPREAKDLRGAAIGTQEALDLYRSARPTRCRATVGLGTASLWSQPARWEPCPCLCRWALCPYRPGRQPGAAAAAPYRPQLLVPLLQRSGLTAPLQPDSCPSGSGPEPSCQRSLKSVSYEAPLSNLPSSALATISRLCASAKKS